MQAHNRGMTLLEIVIYVAILGIVLYFVGGFALNAIFGKDRIANSQDINANGRFMLNTIFDDVEEATAVSGVAN